MFPFDRPAAPEAGGNQALAVNTTDGSVTYSVAFALVWAEDGEPVDTSNEAYAFASCTECAAVAVGFQVVLIVGQADVIVPENLSAAANYNCLRCLTYALASQLVLTLDGPLGEDGMARLNELWPEIAEFGRNIQNVPLSEIQGRLNAYKERIMDIIKWSPAPPAHRHLRERQAPHPAPGLVPGFRTQPPPRLHREHRGVPAAPSGSTTAVPAPAAPITGGATPVSPSPGPRRTSSRASLRLSNRRGRSSTDAKPAATGG